MHPEGGRHLALDGGAEEVARHREREKADIHEDACAEARHVEGEGELAQHAFGGGGKRGARNGDHHEAHGRDEVRGRPHAELEALAREEPEEHHVAHGKGAQRTRPPERRDQGGRDPADRPHGRHHQHRDREGRIEAPLDGVAQLLHHGVPVTDETIDGGNAKHRHHSNCKPVQGGGRQSHGGGERGTRVRGRVGGEGEGEAGDGRAHDGGEPARGHRADEAFHEKTPEKGC